jgi:hypothetical protein
LEIERPLIRVDNVEGHGIQSIGEGEEVESEIVERSLTSGPGIPGPSPVDPSLGQDSLLGG